MQYELNLWLNLTKNFTCNIFESLRHFSRHSNFFWRNTVCESLMQFEQKYFLTYFSHFRPKIFQIGRTFCSKRATFTDYNTAVICRHNHKIRIYNKVENSYIITRIFDHIEKCRYVFYDYNGRTMGRLGVSMVQWKG